MFSFVGLNDDNRKKNGAILTVLENENFGEVHLFWSKSKFYEFDKIGKYVVSEIEKRKLCGKVTLTELKIKDPTDHNEIYPKLLQSLEEVQKSNRRYTAAISSGTPSMQACWILIAESGAFPLKLVRSDDPKWGVPVVRKVKLSAALPRIVKIKKENVALKKWLLSKVLIDKKTPALTIGDSELKLTPVEFAYYSFFANRVKSTKEFLKFGVHNVPEEFYRSVLQCMKETFPEADSVIEKLERSGGITCSTFRTNVTRINKKIASLIDEKTAARYYEIGSEGRKFAKRYGIGVPADLIKTK